MADWLAMKTEYITTDTSYRKLAAKYGLSQVQVSNVGKREGWVELRKQYLSDTLAKSIKKSSDRDANRLSKLMDSTSKAIDVVVGAFGDEDQFNRYVISDGVTAREKIFNKVDSKALKEFTSVLKDLTGLMRDFYNIPTPAQAEAQRIAAERLTMEQKKMEADNDVAEIAVVFEAGEEEWNE